MSFAPFDPRLVRLRRGRAAATIAGADFLLTHAAEEIAFRVGAVNRRFGRVLAVGGGAALRQAGLAAELMVEMDPAPARVGPPFGFAADPERLPIAAGAFDLVVSVLALHTVNDLPGALTQLRLALRPDGLFVGVMLGGATLGPLRAALAEAELAARGGACARVAPFADAPDAGRLLQRAGFALPVADAWSVTVRHGSALALLRDLQAMGETSVRTGLSADPKLTRTILAAALARLPAAADGRIATPFEMIAMTGWAPDPSQQKPLRPGSARMRLAQALGVEERPAGEKAGG